MFIIQVLGRCDRDNTCATWHMGASVNGVIGYRKATEEEGLLWVQCLRNISRRLDLICSASFALPRLAVKWASGWVPWDKVASIANASTIDALGVTWMHRRSNIEDPIGIITGTWNMTMTTGVASVCCRNDAATPPFLSSLRDNSRSRAELTKTYYWLLKTGITPLQNQKQGDRR